MSTHLFVPGPALLAIGPSNGTLSFLGYSVNGVQVQEEMLDVPAMADYAGPRQPADIMIAGKTLTAQLAITDYDPIVLHMALARYSSGTLGGIGPNEIGLLLFSEGATFRLCIRSHRQPLVPLYANYLQGINIPYCFARGPWQYPISTAPQVVPLTFFAWTVPNKVDLSGLLWNEDMTGFPALT